VRQFFGGGWKYQEAAIKYLDSLILKGDRSNKNLHKSKGS